MVEEEAMIISGLLVGLNVIDFNMGIKDEDLDQPVSLVTDVCLKLGQMLFPNLCFHRIVNKSKNSCFLLQMGIIDFSLYLKDSQQFQTQYPMELRYLYLIILILIFHAVQSVITKLRKLITILCNQCWQC